MLGLLRQHRTLIDVDLEIRTMLAEEYGLSASPRSPRMAAAATFAAFLICGAMPLLPYAFGGGLGASALATAITFFAIGSTKSRWSLIPWWRSGLETVAVGLAAAALAYLVGFGLGSLFGIAVP